MILTLVFTLTLPPTVNITPTDPKDLYSLIQPSQKPSQQANSSHQAGHQMLWAASAQSTMETGLSMDLHQRLRVVHSAQSPACFLAEIGVSATRMRLKFHDTLWHPFPHGQPRERFRCGVQELASYRVRIASPALAHDALRRSVPWILMHREDD